MKCKHDFIPTKYQRNICQKCGAFEAGKILSVTISVQDRVTNLIDQEQTKSFKSMKKADNYIKTIDIKKYIIHRFSFC
jgi:hypothetical protein